MTIFLITLSAVYILSLLARFYAKPAVLGPTEYKPEKLCAFAAAALLTMVSALRSNIGDTPIYMSNYVALRGNLEQAVSGKDPGFKVLNALLYRISEDPQLLIFICSVVTNVLILIIIYSYAEPFELGTYLYIAAGSYMVSMNGVRQCLAAAIIFASIRLLLNGDWKKYFVVIILASLLHQSALIMLPVYFVARRETWSRATIIIIAVGSIGFFFFNTLSSIAFKVLEDSQYANYSDSFSMSDLGASPIRAAVSAVPVILAFINRKKLRESWAKSDYIVNLSIINFIFMLFATYNWIVARFCIYFDLYNLILLPWVIKTCVEKQRTLIYYLLVLCFFIMFYYENGMVDSIVYKSNLLGLCIK